MQRRISALDTAAADPVSTHLQFQSLVKLVEARHEPHMIAR
jgi:hypothetical protein